MMIANNATTTARVRASSSIRHPSLDAFSKVRAESGLVMLGQKIGDFCHSRTD